MYRASICNLEEYIIAIEFANAYSEPLMLQSLVVFQTKFNVMFSEAKYTIS
jgi:hypothetical protein